MDRSFYKKLVLILLVPLFSYTIKYIFNILLTHLLQHNLYGDFIMGLRTLNLVASIILLGTVATSKRFLNKYIQTNNYTAAARYIHWNLRLIMRSTVIVTCCLASLLGLMLLLHIFNMKDFRSYHMTFYMLFLSPLGATAILLTTYLESKSKILLYNVFSQAGDYMIYLLVMLAVYYYYAPHFNNIWLWCLSLAVFIILVLINLILIFLYLPRSLFSSIFSLKNLIASNATAESSSWKKASNHFIISGNIFMIITVANLYAVSLLAQDPLAISQYAAILVIVNFFWLLASSVTSYLEPKISTYIEQKNYQALKKAVKESILINTVLSSIVLGFILYFKMPILQKFGQHYTTQATQIALIILAIGFYIGTYTLIFKALLGLSGNERWLICGTSLQLILTIVSSIILTLFYGIIGTAIATTGSIIVKTILYTFVAYRKILSKY